MIPFHESEIRNATEDLGVCVCVCVEGWSFIALHPCPEFGIMCYGAVSALSCLRQTRHSGKQGSTVNAIVLEFSSFTSKWINAIVPFSWGRKKWAAFSTPFQLFLSFVFFFYFSVLAWIQACRYGFVDKTFRQRNKDAEFLSWLLPWPLM